MMLGGGGGGDNESSLSRLNMMSAALPMQLNPATISGGDISAATMKKDDTNRVPQWSHQETRDFISIRAELERDFTLAKRNKTLWEIVSTKMKERGYRRSPDQCKCKWKNLVNRYKGKETTDPESARQCPFFDELHAVFTERAKSMHRLLIESESGATQAKKKVKRTTTGGERSSDELFTDKDDNNNGEDDSEDERVVRSSSRKRKVGKERVQKNTTTTSESKASNSGIVEMLQEFFQQQQRMEMQWREMVERRAMERRMFEHEWRQSMEKLERERLLMDQAWREREEQRRMREESRAEKRDALLTTLLNKLIHEDHL